VCNNQLISKCTVQQSKKLWWQVHIMKPLTALGPRVAQWLRRCATSRTVPGSIPGGVNGIFSDISPSERTMALGSTQPLMKMSTRNIPGVKAAGAWGWPHHLRVPNVMKSGTLWATPDLLRDSFTFTFYSLHYFIQFTLTSFLSVSNFFSVLFSNTVTLRFPLNMKGLF
jgi:hypothetical protein